MLDNPEISYKTAPRVPQNWENRLVNGRLDVNDPQTLRYYRKKWLLATKFDNEYISQEQEQKLIAKMMKKQELIWAWYRKNAERIKQRRKKYYQQHKDKIINQVKKYQQRHRKQFSIQQKKYYEQNREQILASQKKYREDAREKRRAYAKKYRQQHLEQQRGYQKTNYERYREQVLTKKHEQYLAKKKQGENLCQPTN